MRFLDIRIQSSGGILDTVRRVEYLTLLAVAGLAGLFFAPYGALLAGPLVLLALMLVPGRRDPVTSRQQQRLNTLNVIQSAGLALYSRWLALSEQPATQSNAASRWALRRDILVWLAESSDRLHTFPEVAGIYDAHVQKDDLIEELDACITTLSRLRRLVSLSESLKLPI